MSDNLIAIAVYESTTQDDCDLEYDGRFWMLVDGDDETDELAEGFIRSTGEANIDAPVHFVSEPYLFVIERMSDEEE
ncbi:MAG: hypothetical protein EA381_12915 [Planctomycetaceae bacterium]|nr:MAG: hypothetical protein EA381_12915 [Planctomycetaceae bacterium]